LERAQSEAESKAVIAASFKIAAEIPEWWRQLMMELRCDAMEMPKIGINMSVSDNSDTGFENRCRLALVRIGVIPRQTYTDLLHLVGSTTIRCHTLGGKAFKLHFVLRPEGSGIGVNAEESFLVMNPQQTAKFIVKRMTDWIRSRSEIVY
jgi:hypothetical protein